jgi:MFS family permease
MVIGLLASAVLIAGPLAVSGFWPFVGLRALAGLAAGLYDPAARGYLVDATPPDRRGEAFGLYSAAQSAGFLLGPALGALVVAVTGNAESLFLLGGVSVLVAALVVAVAVPERPHHGHAAAVPADGLTELTRRTAVGAELAASAVALDEAGASSHAGSTGAAGHPNAGPPASLWNRTFVAALVLNFGAMFAGGTWEVIWSLFMQLKGASIEFIGFTFALFGLPVLVVSPYVGRLVDRRGSLLFLVLGTVGAVVTGLAYTVTDDLALLAGIVVIEAITWALISPALFAVVATASPAGRSSTAQGVFGAAGTVAYILSSVVSGRLFATDFRYPFYLLVLVIALALIAAVAIAGRARLGGSRPAAPRPREASTA